MLTFWQKKNKKKKQYLIWAYLCIPIFNRTPALLYFSILYNPFFVALLSTCFLPTKIREKQRNNKKYLLLISEEKNIIAVCHFPFFDANQTKSIIGISLYNQTLSHMSNLRKI